MRQNEKITKLRIIINGSLSTPYMASGARQAAIMTIGWGSSHQAVANNPHKAIAISGVTIARRLGAKPCVFSMRESGAPYCGGYNVNKVL